MVKKICLFTFILFLFTLANSQADDSLPKKILLNHLTLSANVERSNKVLKIATDTISKDLTNENVYLLTLKYKISPLGIYNIWKGTSIKPDSSDENTFLNNLNFYVQGNLGNKLTENGEDISALTLKTTDEKSYKFGVSFSWCLGSYKSECNAY